MSGSAKELDGTTSTIATRLVIGPKGLGIIGFVLEAAVILLAAVGTGVGYHLWAYGYAGPTDYFIAAGSLAALLYMLPYLLADQFRVQDFLEGRRNVSRGALVWNYAFFCLALVAFLTKTSDVFSRGWLMLFYVAGLASVLGFEAAYGRVLRSLTEAGRISSRRMMLVGASDEIRRFTSAGTMNGSGAQIVATAALPRAAGRHDAAAIAEALAPAVSKVRQLRVDSVVVLTDWSRAELMSSVIEAFAALPVEIHLGASSIVGRFSDARVSRFGSLMTLSLTAPAMGPLQSICKRGCDIVGAAVALVLLAPLFAVIASLIKLDSPGPVFFRQRRNGFNHHEFQIWKFRTMTTMDDGDVIEQARRGDARVTRLGAFLRRHSLDELPQLINVLRGEMSLVGPRPHAVAHDKMYGGLISTYARRLNVLPGMTGWAQVNGARGPTETEADMRRRVELDLYYIDNWSMALDIYILVRTVVTAATGRNAF